MYRHHLAPQIVPSAGAPPGFAKISPRRGHHNRRQAQRQLASLPVPVPNQGPLVTQINALTGVNLLNPFHNAPYVIVYPQNALPSGTPPPQQHFFTGQTQPGIYEIHSQPGQQPAQPLLTHQAYGSTHTANDLRISGGNGRGAPPHQALPQGGNFYQPNMRPQQQHQAQPQQGTYFITSTPNVRQQRPQQQQQQPTAFFMLPPQGLPAGTNVVIPTQAGQQNMHQYPARVPLFTPPQYQYAPTNYQQTAMYYQPQQAVRGPALVNPAQQARPEPQQRQKKIITIKDPNSGRDLTEELCQRPQSADSQPSEEQVIQQANQTSKEVQHEFVSKVAELLQTTQASNSVPPNEQPQPSIESNGLPQAHFQPPPQQNQQVAHPPQQPNQTAQHPPQNAMHPTSQPQAPHTQQNQMVQQSQQMGHPHQPQQQQPTHVHQNMMRPHMMPHGQNPMHAMNMMGGQGQNMMAQQQNMMTQQQNMMGQQPHPGSGPDMMGHVRPQMTVNLAIPPPAIPQVRQQQPAQMFIPQHGARHPQAPRPQTMPPNTPPPQQVSQPQIPTQLQMQQHVQAMAHPPLVQTSSVPEQPAPPKAALSRANSGPPSSVDKPAEPQPPAPVAANIPIIPPVAMAKPDKAPSPPKETSAPPQVAPAAPPAKKEQTPPPKEETPPQTDEDQFGASTQGKDVRKNKKKKDFSRKDIGGSEMDAFIDRPESLNPWLTKPSLESPLMRRQDSIESKCSSGRSSVSPDSGLSTCPSTAYNSPAHSPPTIEGNKAQGPTSNDTSPTSHIVKQSYSNILKSPKSLVPVIQQSNLIEVTPAVWPHVNGIENSKCRDIVLDRMPGLNQMAQEVNVTCNNHSVDSDTRSSVEAAISQKKDIDEDENKQDNKEPEAANKEKLKTDANEPEEKKPSKPGKSGSTEKSAATQGLSKHQLKKQRKKEKKGRKSPPGQKGKVVNSDTIEQEGKDSVETKPPLPPSATERQTSVEKSPVAVAKPAFSYAAAANNDKPKASPPKDDKPDGDSLSEKAVEPAPAEVPEPTPPVNQKEATPEPPVVKVEAPVVEVAPQVQAPAAPVKAPEPPKEELKPVEVAKPEPVEAPKENGKVEEIAKPPTEEPPKVNDENVPPKEVEQEEAPAEDEAQAGEPRITRDASGRLIYQRQYLLELRSSDRSLARPVNLPDLEIILDNACFSPQPMPVPQAKSSRATMSSSYTPDFTPSFFQPGVGGNQRGPPMPGKRGSQGGRPGDGRENMGGRMGPPQKILTRVSMGNEVKPLHKAEKAWVPKAKTSKEDLESQKTLESATLFIMNRLTPTNFEKLAAEMRGLNLVKTYEDLQELVKIFFDKVTIETKFVSAYAQLCKVMAAMKVPAPPGMKDTAATFRVVLLTKCQQEFEADKASVFEDPDAKRKELQGEMPDAPDKAAKIDMILYHMKLRRLKFYGNIRFIGELFKLNMLTENIMHDCIFRLLKAKDDDSLLSLCNLISTVGSHLDTDKAKTRMDQYFAQMGKIAEEHKSRIKFTLKDVLELRRNHWVSRKGDQGPKKIDDVHKDFEKEQATKQFLANMPPPPRNDPQPNSRRGSRQRPDQEKVSDDGWNTVGTRSMRIDASKMKLSKPSAVDENSIQLGPGGGMNKFSMWSRGSLGAAKPSQPSQDDRQAAPSNRFSALRGDEDRRNFERSPSRENGGRGMRSGPTSGSRGKMMSRSSQEGERRDLLASARSIVGGSGRSQNASRDNSWNRDDRRQNFGPRGSGSREPDLMTRSDITPQRPQREEFRTPAAPAPIKRVKEMSGEDIETKAKNNLEEYLNVRDLKEAKLCVTELAGQPKLYLMVTASYNEVLERTAVAREATGNFMNELIKDNLISLDCYLQGLNEVLMCGEDMVIDIPMIWTYLGQVISPVLVGGALPMASLLKAMKAGLEKRCCSKLLAQILTQVKDKKGEEATAQMWQSGGCSWSDFLPAGEVADFLKDKRLEYIMKASGPAGPNWQKLADDVEANIRDARPNGEIIAYIEKSAGKDTQSKEFIRAITTAVTSSSILRSPNAPKANEDVIKSRKDILQHFIKSNPQQELQALYAIQALMTKLEHPSGVISCLFDTLYDEDVITEESCKQWEKSTDPAEQEGKGVCSMQLTQFFTWLSENDEPEAAS